MTELRALDPPAAAATAAVYGLWSRSREHDREESGTCVASDEQIECMKEWYLQQ